MRNFLIGLLLFLTIFVVSDAPTDKIDNNQLHKIVLITIDGTRYQDIFDWGSDLNYLHGRQIIPNIYHHFMDNGIVIGATTLAFTENKVYLSLPGYSEIMRGYAGNCITNECEQYVGPTIVDQFKGSATVIGSWEPIAKTFNDDGVAINVGRHIRNFEWWQLDISEDGLSKEDDFGSDEYRTDIDTITLATEYLKHEQPDFLWVSLGDTDEFAHRNNYLWYLTAMNYADAFIGYVMQIVDSNTVVIVATDHGRALNFTSHGGDPNASRVWMLIGGDVDKVGFVNYDHNPYLSDIYPTIMELAKGTKSPRSLMNYKH